MTPDYFIRKWKAATLSERAGAHSHFHDLCALLDEATPSESDPTGATYAFEKGVTKTTGGDGWADVWKRGCFAWEYKGKGKDLQAAYAQLQRYAVALENPPLLIVSDIDSIEIHTNWTNTVRQIHRITLDDLADAKERQKLKWAFSDPDRLKPGETRQGLTEKAAEQFASLAQRLRARGYEAPRVAHFVNRLVFCMFAEDVGLLPDKLFIKLMQAGAKNPAAFEQLARGLFGAMRGGGFLGLDPVPWFNGGLFDDDDALPLDRHDLEQTLAAARLDWAEIDPSILGTLFERGLDPDKRSQLGAHYTDRDKIMLIVEPVIVRPLAREWEDARAEAQALLDRAEAAKSPAARTKARKEAEAVCIRYLERLKNFRVLDPACGSGNFLYLALLALKDIEHRANLESEAMGLPRRLIIGVGPENLLGIEINPYAAELARVSVWIGEIQWMLRHNYGTSRDPILRSLNTIECRDALLNPDGTEAQWPRADVIVGNPPFLGGKRMRSSLGDGYCATLFSIYAKRVPAEADLVCYWFAKSREAQQNGLLKRAGLVATNSIRGGANRDCLERIVAAGSISAAWSDEPWVLNGAAVRVSLVCFDPKPGESAMLNGKPVTVIRSDLTANASDLTTARQLASNRSVAFMGDTKGGAFDIPGELAREWLQLPANPNGRPNSDVIKPWANGMTVTRRPADMWVVDFGWTMSEAEASFYSAPFAYVADCVKPERLKNNREAYAKFWWRHVEPRPGMLAKFQIVKRFIVTTRVAKHRTFVWMSLPTLPDSAVIAIARDDDTSFGILHSRFHELWSLGLCTWLGVGNDPRYTPRTTFETFPFPPGLEPHVPAALYADDPRAQAIAEAARTLVEARDRWLNPPELIDIVPEVVPGYPDRIVPRDARAAAILKTRTLTNLYNTRGKPEGAWLDHLHHDLDSAVAAAYGWPADLPDEDVLARLLEMNLGKHIS